MASNVRFVDQISVSSYGDRTGTSVSSSYATSASYADTSLSASYAVSASYEIIKEVSSSHANTADYALTGPFISSSAQIATDISGAFGADSSSFSTRITTNKTKICTNQANISTNQTSITSLTNVTGSYATTGSNSFIGNQNITGDITASGNISASSDIYGVTGSFQHLLGDGSQLTGLDSGSWDGQYSGSAGITGSLTIEGSGSTIFEVQGSAGQLFSVSDGLLGTLMEVKDISGMPLFQVSASGLIEIPVGPLSCSGDIEVRNITASGDISSSGDVYGVTGSFQHLLGDGSQLTNLPSSNPFPFTGDAEITGSLIISSSDGTEYTFSGSSPSMSFNDGQGLFGLDIINTVNSSTNTHGAKIKLTHVDEGATIYYNNGGGGGRYHDALNFISDTGFVFEANAVTGHGPFFDFFSDGASNDQSFRMFNTNGDPKGELRFYTNNGGSSNSMFSLGQSTQGAYMRGGRSPNQLELGLTDYTSYSASMDATLTSINFYSPVTGSTFTGSFVGDGSQLTGITAATNLTQSLFVSPSGDDGTAVVGDLHLPFKTILGATGSANIGDTIIVYPGTYTPTSQIIKDHVNYYFYPGAIVTGSIALMEGTFEKINVRGQGTFEVDADIAAVSITANGYIEFDTFTTKGVGSMGSSNRSLNFTQNTSAATDEILEIKGTGISRGAGNEYTGVFSFNNGKILADIKSFDYTTSGNKNIIIAGTGIEITVNAYAYSENGHGVYISTNSYPEIITLTGHFETGNQANRYGLYLSTGNGADIKVDAHIVGAIFSHNHNNHLTQIHGSQVCSDSPLNSAAITLENGEHLLNHYVRSSTPTVYYLDNATGQVTVTGTAQPEGQYKRLMNVQSGKFVWRGTSFNQYIRAESSLIEGTGTVIIDSPLFHYGANWPNNEYAFILNSADATLEINNKLEYNHDTTGSGILSINSGRLVMDGAQLIHGGGTGSFAYAINLNSGAHSGSILNNSFTNVTPFGPGSFTNEIVGGGTFFYTDKLY